jgi:hypothetical protein
MGVILQVALPSRVLAAARLQCGAAGAGASRGLGVCAEHARLAARGESARAMEIGDFLVWLGPVANSQCGREAMPVASKRFVKSVPCALSRARPGLSAGGVHGFGMLIADHTVRLYPLCTPPHARTPRGRRTLIRTH